MVVMVMVVVIWRRLRCDRSRQAEYEEEPYQQLFHMYLDAKIGWRSSFGGRDFIL
jgi:hypothetical protein